MKKFLLCMGLLLGTVLCAAAQEHPADSLDRTLQSGDLTASAEAVEDISGSGETSVSIALVELSPEARVDSMLRVLESKVDRIDRQNRDRDNWEWSSRMATAGMITGIIITGMVLVAIVLMVFFSQKYRYQRRVKAYELERWRLENGIEIPVALNEGPTGKGMVKFLMFLAIIAEIIVFIVWMAKLGWLSFFPSLLLLIVMGVLGVIIKELFLFLQRRGQNPQA